MRANRTPQRQQTRAQPTRPTVYQSMMEPDTYAPYDPTLDVYAVWARNQARQNRQHHQRRNQAPDDSHPHWMADMVSDVAKLSENVIKLSEFTGRIDERMKGVEADVAALKQSPGDFMSMFANGGGCLGQIVAALISVGALVVAIIALVHAL